MHSIAMHLASQSHKVDVLSSQPSYGNSTYSRNLPRFESVGGVRIRRLFLTKEVGSTFLRIFNSIILGAWILFRTATNNYDVIIVSTIPPVLGGFFSAIGAKLRGARLIYFCMDLHPEIGKLSGDFSSALLYRVLRYLDDWSSQQAKPLLVHSKDMLLTMRKRPNGAKYNIQILNNFAVSFNVQSDESSHFDFRVYQSRLTVIYAGNIGRFQGLETVVVAMGLISARTDINLVIMGDGVLRSTLMATVDRTKSNVRFFDYQPLNLAKSAMRQADIGLVTLMPEMYKYAYPGKTMSYLEQGIPIIAAVEPESELSQEMQSQGYGFVAPIGDANALAQLLVRLADDDSWKSKMNAAALAAFERSFSSQVVLERWSRVVETGSVS